MGSILTKFLFIYSAQICFCLVNSHNPFSPSEVYFISVQELVTLTSNEGVYFPVLQVLL
jgi:hypothetical protein